MNTMNLTTDRVLSKKNPNVSLHYIGMLENFVVIYIIIKACIHIISGKMSL